MQSNSMVTFNLVLWVKGQAIPIHCICVYFQTREECSLSWTPNCEASLRWFQTSTPILLLEGMKLTTFYSKKLPRDFIGNNCETSISDTLYSWIFLIENLIWFQLTLRVTFVPNEFIPVLYFFFFRKWCRGDSEVFEQVARSLIKLWEG